MKPHPAGDWKRRSGGLLLPGAPRTALTYLGSECDSLAAVVVRTYQWSDDGGTMPGKSGPFTTRVEPVSPPCPPFGPSPDQGTEVVEAPGTAPGSATLMPSRVYRHSRRGGRRNIGDGDRRFEGESRMALTAEQQAEIEAARGAEGRTRRPTVPALEAMLFEPLPVLDHGFVRVIDYMGDDSAIVQAARVSYGRGTKKVQEDAGLIRYLMRHRHSTPFEMCEAKFHVKLPIFVARQWIRHRTANVNEYSARYSILDREFYIPAREHLAAQSSVNRQGRGD